MPGFSLTLLLLPSPSDNVPSTPDAATILSLLDDSANTPGWRWSSGSTPGSISQSSVGKTESSAAVPSSETTKIPAADPSAFLEAIKRSCTALINEEPEITRMDNIAGDGDCGLTLKAGATGTSCSIIYPQIVFSTTFYAAVLKEVESGRITGHDVVGSVIAIAGVAEEQMGGTSGALYS